MSRRLTFKFRLNQAEKFLLFAVAEKLRRSQGDTLRMLIHSTAQELDLEPAQHIRESRDGKGIKSDK
jgi:hypothetical protein